MAADGELAAMVRTFGLNPSDFKIERIPSGYIHSTYKLLGSPSYILQRVNKNVFRQPEVIASNLRCAADYLARVHSEYLFLSAQPNAKGAEMSYDTEGFPWRLFRYIENSITIDRVETSHEAFNASAAFARLTAYLSGAPLNQFKPTIDKFHDLGWRYQQFQDSLGHPDPARLKKARQAIETCEKFGVLVRQYNELISDGSLQPRVTHNDTKINNILLDADSREAICVIDLDTLMPGYFIYDVGDMIRTFVSPANEEENDLSKIEFRSDIYKALIDGYLSQMESHLNTRERSLFPFSGMMMTYIMALRMLADYLNGDVYYQIKYPEQNYLRAINQLRLLEILSEHSSTP